MTNSNFDALASVLFDGPVRVDDIKTMAGSDVTATREQVSIELTASLLRMGLVKDGKLVDKNKS